MKIYRDIQQGSEEWEELRLGRMTASRAAVFLVNGRSGNGLGVAAKSYIYEKAGQIITGETIDFKGNYFTERGNDLEPLAIEAYEDMTYNTVDRVGFIELNQFVGFSPDGLVDDNGLIEVKCPEQTEFIRIIDTGDVPKEHLAQMQFGLFVSGREWCDYVRYHPKFGPKKLLIDRIERDEEMINTFREKAKVFEAEIKRLTSFIYDYA